MSLFSPVFKIHKSTFSFIPSPQYQLLKADTASKRSSVGGPVFISILIIFFCKLGCKEAKAETCTVNKMVHHPILPSACLKISGHLQAEYIVGPVGHLYKLMQLDKKGEGFIWRRESAAGFRDWSGSHLNLYFQAALEQPTEKGPLSTLLAINIMQDNSVGKEASFKHSNSQFYVSKAALYFSGWVIGRENSFFDGFPQRKTYQLSRHSNETVDLIGYQYALNPFFSLTFSLERRSMRNIFFAPYNEYSLDAYSLERFPHVVGSFTWAEKLWKVHIGTAFNLYSAQVGNQQSTLRPDQESLQSSDRISLTKKGFAIQLKMQWSWTPEKNPLFYCHVAYAQNMLNYAHITPGQMNDGYNFLSLKLPDYDVVVNQDGGATNSQVVSFSLGTERLLKKGISNYLFMSYIYVTYPSTRTVPNWSEWRTSNQLTWHITPDVSLGLEVSYIQTYLHLKDPIPLPQELRGSPKHYVTHLRLEKRF